MVTSKSISRHGNATYKTTCLLGNRMKCLGDYPLRLGFGLPRTILPDLREEGKRAMLPRIPPFIMFSCHSQGHQLASRRVNVFNRIRSDGALKRATPGFLKCQCHAVAW